VRIVWIENSLWTFHIHTMEQRVYCIYDEAIKGERVGGGTTRSDGDGSWLLHRCEPFLGVVLEPFPCCECNIGNCTKVSLIDGKH
jgi:hypothetical protein